MNGSTTADPTLPSKRNLPPPNVNPAPMNPNPNLNVNLNVNQTQQTQQQQTQPLLAQPRATMSTDGLAEYGRMRGRTGKIMSMIVGIAIIIMAVVAMVLFRNWIAFIIGGVFVLIAFGMMLSAYYTSEYVEHNKNAAAIMGTQALASDVMYAMHPGRRYNDYDYYDDMFDRHHHHGHHHHHRHDGFINSWDPIQPLNPLNMLGSLENMAVKL